MTTTAEMIAVLQAFEAGKTIEYRHKSWGPSAWERAPTPTWNWDAYYYRIAPSPKRKVTMYCYYTGHAMYWFVNPHITAENYQRIPAEDKIIEVEK